jgi:transcriptional regulator, propionate catabolism operon regulatory protein
MNTAHQRKKFRFALVSHSMEVVNIVRKYSDPQTEDLFTTIVGLDDAVPTARGLIQDGYEVILGHGGTGGIIATRVGQPVVNIPMTMLEVITALLKAAKLGTKIGVTSFAAGREGFEVIRQVLGVDARQIIFNSQRELEEGVEKAIADGIDVVVGGGVSRKIAARFQTRAVIIEPGMHMVQEALSQARALAAARRREMEYHERLRTIFEIMDDGMICVDAFGYLNFYNQTAETMLGMDLGPYLGRSVSDLANSLWLVDVLNSGTQKTDEIINIRNSDLVANCFPILSGGRVIGAVSLLKEVNTIHNIDRKLRERIYRKGFIAKRTMADIVAVSPGMRKLIAKAKKFAKTETAILICGETGTGKEYLTQALHNISLRKKAPFVAINCAALPESLLESELFGYEEGAFTGAKKGGKIGLFELANRGTIFLDEIGDISANLQVRLLRVLENKEVMRVGGDRIVPVDVRVISSTHKDLQEEVRAGRFRNDLYYRLAVLRLNIPPLRRRMQDIPELLMPLLARYGKPLSCMTPEILKMVQSYHWPGNIRELNSLMESYLILLSNRHADQRLFTELFKEYQASPGPDSRPARAGKEATVAPVAAQADMQDGRTLPERVKDHKLKVIRQTLRGCGNNKALAAKILGISTNTLWRALNPDGA